MSEEENDNVDRKPEETPSAVAETSARRDDDLANRYRSEPDMAEDTSGDEPDEARAAMIKEWVKFGVLVAVLFGAVFIVWASRPLIFGQIVPAVMSANPPTTAVVNEPNEPIEDAPPTTSESETGTETEGATEQPPLVIEEEVTITVDVVTEGEGEAEGDAPEATTDETETSPEAPEVRTIPYTVEQGDSLFAIGRRYGVSVDQILAVNNIPNPNNIQPGTEIQIPVP